ncbi:hypothetical protein HDU96_001811 [Phlyctochytrium bullatum]|nr:hypothetical protein HDU96_001811 [Phlyctochytrium bullatum]
MKQRHTGSSNEVVYGALIGGYVRRKMYVKALDAFKEMKRKRLVPTPATCTLLFKAMAGAAASVPADLDYTHARFVDLVSVWRRMDPDSRNLIHINAVLSACCDLSAADGSFDAAMRLFAFTVASDPRLRSVMRADDIKIPRLLDLSEKKEDSEAFERPSQSAAADLRVNELTLTAALRLIAKSDSSEAYEAAKFIWDVIIPNLRVPIDGFLATAFLLSCERHSSQESLKHGVQVAEKWFFGKADKSGTAQKRRAPLPRLLVAPSSSDVMMRIACKLKAWDFGYRCLMLSQKAGVRFDYNLVSSAVTILLHNRKLHEAWELQESILSDATNTMRSASLRLRICLHAVESTFPEGSPEDSEGRSLHVSSADIQSKLHWLESAVQSVDEGVEAHLCRSAYDSTKSQEELQLFLSFLRVLQRCLSDKELLTYKRNESESYFREASRIVANVGEAALKGIDRFFEVKFSNEFARRHASKATLQAARHRLHIAAMLDYVVWDILSRLDKNFDERGGDVMKGTRKRLLNLKSEYQAFERRWAETKEKLYAKEEKMDNTHGADDVSDNADTSLFSAHGRRVPGISDSGIKAVHKAQRRT